jgi:hypothetical protein
VGTSNPTENPLDAHKDVGVEVNAEKAIYSISI